MTKIMLNGVLQDMSAEEEQKLQDVRNEANTQREEALAQKQAKENAQVSGNQKLLDLGLTQAEATALTGYTPPKSEE